MGPQKKRKESTKNAERQQAQMQRLQQEGQQVAAQVQDPQQQKKPGFFRRVWNWVKGAFSRLFSKKKNTETQSGGDAADTFAQTQAEAPVPDAASGTLTPEQTAPDVAAAETTQETAETATPEAVTETTETTSEAAPKAATAAESPKTAPAKAPAIEEGGNLTLGSMTFTIQAGETEGSYKSMAGTAQVLGQQVNWTSQKGVDITKGPKGTIANGAIHLSDDRLDFDNVLVSGKNEGVTFLAGEESSFLFHAGETDLSFTPEGGLGDLSTLSGKQVKVENRTISLMGEVPAFADGTITLPGQSDFELENTQQTLNKNQVPLPEYLSAAGIDLSLQKQESGVVMALDFHKMAVHMGKFNFLSVDTPGETEAQAIIDASGNAALSLPSEARYRLRLFNGLVSKDVSDLFGNLTLHLGAESALSAIEFHPMEFSVGGFQFQDFNLRYDFGQGFSAKIGALSGMEGRLTASNTEAKVLKSGFDIPQLTLQYQDPEGLALQQATFNVQGFHIGADGVMFQQAQASLQSGDTMAQNAMTVLSGTVTLQKQPDLLQMDINATGQFEHYGDTLDFTGKAFSFSMHYAKHTAAAATEGAAPAQGAAQQESGGENQLSDFSIEINGDIQAVVKLDNIPVADVTFSRGISIRNNTFFLGSMEAFLDLDSLNSFFSGMGTVKAEQVSINSTGLNVQNFLIFCQGPALFGKSLGESFLLRKDPATGYQAEISLSDDLKFSLAGMEIALNEATVVVSLNANGFVPGLKSSILEIGAGDSTITAEIENMQFGQPIEIETLSLENEHLTKAAKDVLHVDDLQLEVHGLTIGPAFDSVTFQEIGATIQKDIPLFDSSLKLTEISFSVVAPNLSAFEGVKVGGALKYEGNGIIKEVSGKATLGMLKEKGYAPSFEGLSDLKLAIRGYGTAEISSVEPEETGQGFILKDVSISRNDADSETVDIDGGGEDDSVVSFLQKLITIMPRVEFLATEIRYGARGFELNPKNVMVKSVQSNVPITDDLLLLFNYERNKKVGAALRGSYYLPENRKSDKTAKKRIFEPPLFAYPILPMLTVNVNAFLDAGLDFAGEAGVEFSSGSFLGKMGASCGVSVGAGVGAYVVIGVPGLNVSLGLEGSLGLDATGKIDGAIGALYDSSKPTLAQALSMDREQTHFMYDFTAALNFDVAVKAGAKVPSVFDSSTKSLKKSWNLFHYNLGNAAISGKIFYLNDELQIETNSQINFNKPGAFHFDEEVQKLEALTTSINQMEADNEEVCRILDENEDALGLGEVRDTLRLKQSIVILEMLEGTMKDSAANYKKVQETLERLRKILPKMLEMAHRGELIREDTKQIAEIAGISVNENGDPDKNWYIFLQEQDQKRKDPKYIRQLAMMDPLALFNTFKAYKGYNDKSWKAEYAMALSLSQKMRDMELSANGNQEASPTQSETDKKNSKLLSQHLGTINSLIGDRFQKVKKSNKSLLGLSAELDVLEQNKKDLQDQDILTLERMDALSQASTEKEKKEASKLERDHKTIVEKLVKLSKEAEKKRIEVEAARANSLDTANDARKNTDFAVMNNAFASAEERMGWEKTEYGQQYDRIAAGRTQETREAFLEENQKFVSSLLDKLIGTHLANLMNPITTVAQAASTKQAEQVKKRSAQVAQGEIVEERIQSAFFDKLQGKTGEEWRQLHDDYFQRGIEFEAQHKKALSLYGRLIASPFKNQDDEDRSKVSEQNKLLQEACTALGEGLSAAGIKSIEKSEVESLNAKVAAIASVMS